MGVIGGYKVLVRSSFGRPSLLNCLFAVKFCQITCYHFCFLIFTDCSDGWVNFGKFCYIFSNTGLNRTEALAECKNFDSHITVSRNEEANNFLVSHMQSPSSWLGLSDEVTEGNFVWRFDNYSYQNWNDNHPKTGNAGENVDYVEIEKSSGKWNNIYGNESIGNICEKRGKELYGVCRYSRS